MHAFAQPQDRSATIGPRFDYLGRSIVHFILFLLCLYFGFLRKPDA
jgi:hypothetical protein